MLDPTDSRRAATLLEQADRPLPSGPVPPGTTPIIAVGARPDRPGHAVLVEMRQPGGPGRFLRVVTEAAGEGAQWFRALLPPLGEGDSVDYRVELVRSGELLATLPSDGSWLTVTGDRGTLPDGAPPCRPQGAQRPYDLQHLAAVTIALRSEIIGETPDGYRINFFVEEGRARGPRIDALIRRDGGDWLRIRRDGIAVLDARMTWEMADGALVDYRSGGLLDLGDDGYGRAATGRLAGSPPFYATPTFATSHPRWQWLNRVQGFGFGRVDLEHQQIRYDIHIPQQPAGSRHA